METVTAVVRPKWMSSPPGNRSLANTATIGTSTAQTDATNDSKSASLAITFAQVDLIANVVDVPSFVGVNPDPLGFDTLVTSNNVITYRARITNAGPSEATGVKFTSTYTPPAGRTVTFLCDSTDQYSCTRSVRVLARKQRDGHGHSARLELHGAESRSGKCLHPLSALLDRYCAGLDGRLLQQFDLHASQRAGSEQRQQHGRRADRRAREGGSAGRQQDGADFLAAAAVWAGRSSGRSRSTTAVRAVPSTRCSPTPCLPTWSCRRRSRTASGPGGGTCSAGGVSQFTCNLGDIAPGDVQTITVNVFLRKPSGTPPTVYTNTASATTFSVDPDPTNNSDTGTVTLVKSSIAGSVYRDHNNNGVKDGGENGINGVQIALTGHDVFNNTVSRTATTDASGNYLLDNLEQADATGYTLTESQPSGYSDGIETPGTAATGTAPGGTVSATVGSNTISGVKLDKDQVATGYLFGELRQNTLGGTVFADVDNNGAKAAGEPGIQNVTVTLSGTDVRAARRYRSRQPRMRTARTASRACCPALTASSRLSLSPMWTASTRVGNRGGTVANDQFSAIALTDLDGTGYNFGERPAVHQRPCLARHRSAMA